MRRESPLAPGLVWQERKKLEESWNKNRTIFESHVSRANPWEVSEDTHVESGGEGVEKQKHGLVAFVFERLDVLAMGLKPRGKRLSRT